MKPTRKGLVAIAAALSTIAVAAPISTASAEGTLGTGVTVVGPVITTTAPSSFVNTNNQVSAAATSDGVQVWGP
jgi:hypothetical protein